MATQIIKAVGYVLLFALLYYLLMTVFGLIVISTGIHPGAMNIVGIIIASTAVALLFIRRNRRLFSRSEYFTVLLGSFLVDLTMELGFIALGTGHISLDKWPGMINIFGGHALLLALAYSPWSWLVRGYAKRFPGP